MTFPVFACCLLAGATVVALLPALPGAWAWGVLPAATALAGAHRRARPIAGLPLGIALALAAAQLALGDRLDASLEGRDLLVEGLVAEIPQVAPGRQRLLLEVEQASAPAPRRLQLSWYDTEVRPGAGERWRLAVRLRRPRGSVNPGAFDAERWWLSRRIGATGYVRESGRNARLAVAPARSLLALRARLAGEIRARLGDRPGAAIVLALGLGIRDGISPGQWRVLRRTGTAHLMAISGLHVGMAAGLGWLLAGGWPRRPGGPGRRQRGTVAALALASAYAALAGFSLPTRRALVMLAAGLGSRLLGREAGALRPLCAALVTVLVADPLVPLSPGFWLSFLAVAALLATVGARPLPPPGWRTAVAAQPAVWLALLVPGLTVFGGLAPVAPLVNLVAIPLFGIAVVPAVLLGLALLVTWPAAGGWLLGLVATTLERLWPALEAAATVPGAWLSWPGLPTVALVVLALGATLGLAPAGLPGRWLAPALLAAGLAWRAPAPPPGSVRLAVLDVGQGLSVAVETRRHVLVFDAGPAWRGGGDAGERIVAPYLRWRGHGRVDALVISHGDNDHRGGAAGVAAALEVGRIVAGPDALAGGLPAGPPVVACADGQAWTWDGVRFAFLHPPAAGGFGGNDSSCVLAVETAAGRVLLTGDIEAAGERALLGRDLAAALVIAPHHGSDTSSRPGLVRATRPRWVVFPAARGNRWGFPTEAVRSRWQAAGAATLTTGEAGAVILELGPGRQARGPAGWRCLRRRFWREAACEEAAFSAAAHSKYHSGQLRGVPGEHVRDHQVGRLADAAPDPVLGHRRRHHHRAALDPAAQDRAAR